jgi:uncharacterized protein YbjQ (UPF0145 family)
MIMTTTSTIEGHALKEYKGIVVGEAISGIDFIKDMATGHTIFFKRKIRKL